MKVALIHLWFQTKYRWLCATGASEARRDVAVHLANQTWEPWCDAGFPMQRLLWASAWITHWLLFPLRKTIGIR